MPSVMIRKSTGYFGEHQAGCGIVECYLEVVTPYTRKQKQLIQWMEREGGH